MYVCMYVCVYVCMCVYICIYIHTYVHTYIHIYIYIMERIRMYIFCAITWTECLSMKKKLNVKNIGCNSTTCI